MPFCNAGREDFTMTACLNRLTGMAARAGRYLGAPDTALAPKEKAATWVAA